ncbi:MAG: pantoate--beta-alanine ligase [Thermoleophilia bacterium]|nr:pantoate--beta-alanine ligase [Thermoleophilia bacterium]
MIAQLVVASTRAELDDAVARLRLDGGTVAFVPTMGALHDGHAELVRRARAECANVVVSAYVNPLQFGAGEDLDRYPRTPDADAAIVARAGADVLWRPGDDDVHGASAGPAERAGGLGAVLEGLARPGHFDGVATVVARLLRAVAPDVLYLGEKDFQQLAVVRALVDRLGLPVRVRAVPTVRDVDGLALSSRNAYLDADDRCRAASIPRALDAATTSVAAGERSAAAVQAVVLDALTDGGVQDVDYVAIVDPLTLDPVDRLDHPAQLLVAVRVGATRLIDNLRLDPPHVPRETP